VRHSTAIAALTLLLFLPRPARAYSVLTHEAIIDATWDGSMVPILRSRFHPSADALRRARAFAYGGCMIQDIGYYPLSGLLFGELAHYVRSGDFVIALLREAHTLDEEAFALGALSHYVADTAGHPRAVNVAVPLIYPKLAARYGHRMTYEDDPVAHLRTEFGFDVIQIARGHYVPEDYHDFIGFEVATPLLERAFNATYGLSLNDVFPNLDLAIGTFRRSVSTIIPSMTKVAWETKHDEIEKRFPATNRDRFLFALTRADYERQWGRRYERPNPGHVVLSWLFRLIPKIGPLRILAFKPPTPEAEKLFLASFTHTVAEYRSTLSAVARNRLSLNDVNFDTGRPIHAGDYGLVDQAYAHWVNKLEHQQFVGASRSIRANILAFYANPEAPIATKAHRGDWHKLQRELDELRETAPASAGVTKNGAPREFRAPVRGGRVRRSNGERE
jgi:Zinc dependent phospholipase C